MIRSWLLYFVLLLPLQALEFGEDLEIQFFGTFDATYTDNAYLEIPAIIPSKARFAQDEWDFRNSLVGVQAQYNLNENLTLALQTLATEFFQNDYQGILEWAYLSFDLGDDFFVRAGRFKIPYLVGNELRYVGYSRLWVRPIVPIDGVGGFNDYIGVETIKKFFTQESVISLQASMGKAKHMDESIEDRFLGVLNTRIDYGQMWLSLSLLHALYDVENVINEATMTMASLEAKVALGDWMVHAGYSHGQAQIIRTEDFAYASIGYVWGLATPYVTYTARNFSQTLLTQERVRTKNQVISAGIRLDMWLQSALKLQWDHYQNDTPQNIQEEANFEANLFTIALDVVF